MGSLHTARSLHRIVSLFFYSGTVLWFLLDYFTPYQLFQLQVVENPTPKWFIKKRILIHVIEKFWLQAQLDPGAQIRSNKVGLSITLSTKLASLSRFLWWQNGSGNFEPCIQSTPWPGEGEEFSQQRTVPMASGKKIYFVFTISVLSWEHPGASDGGEMNVTPTWLNLQSLNLTTHLESCWKRGSGWCGEKQQWLWCMSSTVMDLLARKGGLVYEIRLFSKAWEITDSFQNFILRLFRTIRIYDH